MSEPALQGSEVLGDDLCAREREVLATIVLDGGHAQQKDVVEALDIGRDHVARHIDALADAGHLRKVSLGRENVLFLPGCEPEILQPSLEGAMHR